MKKYEIAYHCMQKQSARIECENNLLKPASDIVRSAKTTAYDQNNNIQWYFHIFKAQKKFKVQLNSSRNCSVCVRITFDEMESSFANPRQPGTVLNRPNARLSKIFTEFPPKGSFKLLKNIKCLLRHVKRFQKFIWFFSGQILRACAYYNIARLSTTHRWPKLQLWDDHLTK